MKKDGQAEGWRLRSPGCVGAQIPKLTTLQLSPTNRWCVEAVAPDQGPRGAKSEQGELEQEPQSHHPQGLQGEVEQQCPR